ncbi:MAG: hypothetical protein ACI97N_002657, partial [Cognaticolwellia sp.]
VEIQLKQDNIWQLNRCFFCQEKEVKTCPTSSRRVKA